jgi:Tol biopolymer transport system component
MLIELMLVLTLSPAEDTRLVDGGLTLSRETGIILVVSAHAAEFCVNRLLLADSTLNRIVCKKEQIGALSISADAKEILYSAVIERESRRFQLYIYNAETSNDEALITSEYSDTEPVADPGGDIVAFARGHRRRPYSLGGERWDKWDICFLSRKDKGVLRLTTEEYYNISKASFAPDGASLVYAARMPGARQSAILALQTEGGAKPKELFTSGSCWAPSFSPKGDEIVFINRSDSMASLYEYEVWIIDRNGGNPRKVTTTRSYNSSPYFLNENTILFLSDPRRAAVFGLWSVQRDGTGLRHIVGVKK